MITALAFATLLNVAHPAVKPTRAPSRTQWKVRTAPGLDMALLIGPLSGDPLVQRRNDYAEERAWAQANLPTDAKTALRSIHQIVDADQGIVTAFLALFLSAGPVETIDDVIRSIRDPAPLLRRLAKDPNWHPEQNGRVHKLRAPVLLVEARYAEWQATPIRTKLAQLKDHLQPYDIIPLQEKLLGRPLDPTIEVLVLAYNRPFDTSSKRLWAALAPLARDPWMVNVVKNHDPAYGYRTFEGIVNEDSTRALDQLVSEQLGIARDMGARVRRDDEGMHVLSAALYSLLKETGYAERGGRYEDWLIGMAEAGKLSPTEVKRRAIKIAGEATVHQLESINAHNILRAPHLGRRNKGTTADRWLGRLVPGSRAHAIDMVLQRRRRSLY